MFPIVYWTNTVKPTKQTGYTLHAEKETLDRICAKEERTEVFKDS